MSPLPPPVHLLVPMHVDAFVVGQRPRLFEWASLAPRFGDLGDGRYATGIDLRLKHLFVKAAANPPAAGIHLHFKLPAALTHGSGAELEFPRIPNRWLVQRWDRARAQLSKAWLVRSDARADAASGAVALP